MRSNSTKKDWVPLIGATLLFLYALSYPQKTADFLVLEQPERFTILNQYQQPLSDKERAALAPGFPLQIINAEETLGDQITRAVQGSFDNRTWFLQKDDSGNLLGGSENNGVRTYKGCTVAYDTVDIVKDNSIRFSEKAASGSGTQFLKKGENIKRIFQYRGQWYVRRAGRAAAFGWSSFSDAPAWRRIKAVAVADTGISDFLQQRIIERFRTANNTYRKYFSHFNKITGKEKTIPQWQWDLGQALIIHCYLNAPYRTGSQLEESTRYLVRDLENMLIGKQYEVVCEKGDITLKPKERDADAP
jgi:hypothetical protein